MSYVVENVARAMFATDWPKDDWERFRPGDVATNRYLAMARSALATKESPQGLKEWREARKAFLALPAGDKGTREALNRLSDAEDKLYRGADE